MSYIQAAIEMRSVKDAEADYNASLSMGADQFPLEMLAPEERANTGTDTKTNQGSWLDRLFEQAAAQFIGVTFNSVGPGVASFPVTTAGASASQQAKSEAASDTAWTVDVTEMKPKRNAVHAIFSIEDAQRIGPGLEDALQRDLRMALVEGIDRSIFKGDSGPSGTGSDIVGFQSAGITENTLTQSNKPKGDKILELLAGYIDGKHAVSPADLRIVASVGTNVLWMTKLQAAAVDNMTVAQFLRASGISWTTRGGIDTNTSNGDFGAYIGLGQGIAGAAVAAVWSSGSLIRDPFSGAKSGSVGITLNTLWDFKLPRTSNFRRLKYVSANARGFELPNQWARRRRKNRRGSAIDEGVERTHRILLDFQSLYVALNRRQAGLERAVSAEGSGTASHCRVHETGRYHAGKGAGHRHGSDQFGRRPGATGIPARPHDGHGPRVDPTQCRQRSN